MNWIKKNLRNLLYDKEISFYNKFIIIKSKVRFYYFKYEVVFDKFTPLLNSSENQIIGLIVNESRSDVNIPQRDFNKSSKSKFCGEMTSEWTIHYGADKTCICRRCKQIGR